MAFWNRKERKEQSVETENEFHEQEVKAENEFNEQEAEAGSKFNEQEEIENEFNELDAKVDNAFSGQENNNNETEKKTKSGIFKRLVSGLSKTRNSISSGLGSIFSRSKIDEEFYEDIEEILVMSDVGVRTAMSIVDRLRKRVSDEKIKEPLQCKELLIESMKAELGKFDNLYDFENKKTVVLVIGVNGAGKTTTIGKLASQYKASGKTVLMAAADTFRAAATQQLEEWAKRSETPIVMGSEGSDPASVLYDAINSAKAKGIDILLCDSAGRLHNKKNLMDELHKLKSVITKGYVEAHIETLIVLDGTTGQNALNQAKEFKEAVGEISGAIITKLDGTAKGGMAIAIESELGIPVKYIGVGEKIDDLQKFNGDEFVDALFS